MHDGLTDPRIHVVFLGHPPSLGDRSQPAETPVAQQMLPAGLRPGDVSHISTDGMYAAVLK